MRRFQCFYNKASKNKTKTVWVLKCDIKKFFASIDHQILKHILQKHIFDADVLELSNKIIDSFQTDFTNPTLSRLGGKGLPLGNLTSQLLVNVYMNEFDQYIKHTLKIKYYVRYADDFVILRTDKTCLSKILIQISNFLNQKLKLTLHPNKVSITSYASGVDFLGFVHFPKHRNLRTKTKKRMFMNLKKGNYKEKGLNSYLGMLSHGDTFKLKNKINKTGLE